MFSFWLCCPGNRPASFLRGTSWVHFLSLLRERLSPSCAVLVGSRAWIPPYYFRIREVYMTDTVLSRLNLLHIYLSWFRGGYRVHPLIMTWKKSSPCVRWSSSSYDLVCHWPKQSVFVFMCTRHITSPHEREVLLSTDEHFTSFYMEHTRKWIYMFILPLSQCSAHRQWFEWTAVRLSLSAPGWSCSVLRDLFERKQDQLHGYVVRMHPAADIQRLDGRNVPLGRSTRVVASVEVVNLLRLLSLHLVIPGKLVMFIFVHYTSMCIRVVILQWSVSCWTLQACRSFLHHNSIKYKSFLFFVDVKWFGLGYVGGTLPTFLLFNDTIFLWIKDLSPRTVSTYHVQLISH